MHANEITLQVVSFRSAYHTRGITLYFMPARLPLNAFTAIQAVGMPERFVQLSPFALKVLDSISHLS